MVVHNADTVKDRARLKCPVRSGLGGEDDGVTMVVYQIFEYGIPW